MSTMRLVDPSDLVLDMAFALHVAGWHEVKQTPKKDCRYWMRRGGKCEWSGGVSYLTSVDAILPYLDAWVTRDSPLALRRFSIERSGHDYVVDLRGYGPSAAIYHGDSLPRALVICLLRAHSVEITFT